MNKEELEQTLEYVIKLNNFGKEIDEWAVWTESLHTDLVAYWSLDENTGTLTEDVHTGNYNGTVNTNVTWTTDGRIQNATNLDTITPGQYQPPINITNNPTMDTNYTFSARVIYQLMKQKQ